MGAALTISVATAIAVAPASRRTLTTVQPAAASAASLRTSRSRMAGRSCQYAPSSSIATCASGKARSMDQRPTRYSSTPTRPVCLRKRAMASWATRLGLPLIGRDNAAHSREQNLPRPFAISEGRFSKVRPQWPHTQITRRRRSDPTRWSRQASEQNRWLRSPRVRFTRSPHTWQRMSARTRNDRGWAVRQAHEHHRRCAWDGGTRNSSPHSGQVNVIRRSPLRRWWACRLRP
jgi:hypothetical protein